MAANKADNTHVNFLGLPGITGEQRLDPRSGRALDRPARLTNWAGVCLDSLSASADSKHLAFTHWDEQTNILIGDLGTAGRKGFAPAPFTMNEAWNNFLDWTNDSKAVLFASNRNGKWEIFLQSIGADNPRSVVDASTVPELSPKTISGTGLSETTIWGNRCATQSGCPLGSVLRECLC